MKTSLTIIGATFDCARTCPANRTHWCRFNALFRLIGATARVHSHTVKVKVPYSDPDTLERACRSLGWRWLGHKTHELFDGSRVGHGFLPDGWTYPAVFADGEIHSDTFNGRWGDDAQLDKIKTEYAIASAQRAAEELGWQCERTADGLTVHHPTGGILHVGADVCETTGFLGDACHAAREALGLLADGQVQNTPEFSQVRAEVREGT